MTTTAVDPPTTRVTPTRDGVTAAVLIAHRGAGFWGITP